MISLLIGKEVPFPNVEESWVTSLNGWISFAANGEKCPFLVHTLAGELLRMPDEHYRTFDPVTRLHVRRAL